jgi:hypothetical protein
VRAAVSLAHQPAPDAFPVQSGNPASDLATDIIDHNSRPDLDASASSSRVAQPTVSASTKSATVASADKVTGRATGAGIEAIEADMAALPAPLDSIGEPVAQQLTDPILAGATDTQDLAPPEPVESQLPPSALSSDEILTTPGSEPPLTVESNFPKHPSRQELPPTGLASPAPLMPSVARPTSTSSAAAAQMPPAASESPNEVHVHIGRIEVTALQPDAAPKPKPRTARQPMSLDDYLARRRQNLS